MFTGVASAKFLPWLLLAAVVAIAGSHVWAYVHWTDVGAKDERAAQLEAIEKTRAKIQADHEADLKRRGWQDVKEAEDAAALRAALESELDEIAGLAPETLIVTKVVRDEETGCDRPVAALSHDFWLRYRAAGGQRGEADSAAAGSVLTRM